MGSPKFLAGFLVVIVTAFGSPDSWAITKAVPVTSRVAVQEAGSGASDYQQLLQYAADHPIRTFTIQVLYQSLEPVPAATLTVFVGGQPAIHRADENGRCEMHLPELDTIRAVVIASDESGLQLGLLHLRSSLENNKTGELRMALHPASRTEVLVVDQNGQPVAGATAGVKSLSIYYATAITDEKGRAELLIPWSADARQVFAWSRIHGMDYCRAPDKFAKGGDREAVPAEPVRLRLDGFQEPITVTVTDETGIPVEGVTVMPDDFQKLGDAGSFSWFGSDGRGPFDNVTGNDGVVTFREIPVWVEGHLMFSVTRPGFTADRVYFSDLRGTRQLTSTIVAKQLVKGHVTDENGQPAANLSLRMNGRFFKRSNMLDRASELVSTDSNGDFQFWAAPYGAWLPHVVDPNKVLDGPAIFTVTKDEPVADVQLKLRKPTLLKGVITTGEDKTPIANEVVRFEVSESAMITTFRGMDMPILCSHEIVARSNDAGEFQIHAGYGHYKVKGPAHFSEVFFGIDDETEKSFVMHHSLPAKGVLRGKVISGIDFQPVAGAQVSFRYLDENMYDKGEMSAQFVTDAEGKFETDRKWATVLVHVCSEDRSQAAFVEVGNEPELAKIKLMPTQTLTGRLLDGAGKPIVDSFVFATRIVGRRNLGGSGAKTDTDGRFSIRGVLPDIEYRLDYTNLDKGGDVMATIAKFTPEPGNDTFDIGDVTYGRVPPGNVK